MSLRHQKNIKKGAKMEPETLLKRLPKTIVKKDGKKKGKMWKSDPFLSRPKSEIGPKGPQKIRKGAQKGVPTIDPNHFWPILDSKISPKGPYDPKSEPQGSQSDQQSTPNEPPGLKNEPSYL